MRCSLIDGQLHIMVFPFPNFLDWSKVSSIMASLWSALETLRQQPPFDIRAYLEELAAKLEREEEPTVCEKRALLLTEYLGFKALVFPETLTPAERNRCQFMPPPDEVEANIVKVTDGALSRPEEILQKAIDSAETKSDTELTLILQRFEVHEPVYESINRRAWARRLSNIGELGDLACNSLQTELLTTATLRAWKIYAEERGGIAPFALDESYSTKTSEEIAAYHEADMREKQLAAEKVRRWDEQDRKLFEEARTSMFKMADERDAVLCPWKAFRRGGQRFCKAH